MEIKYWGRGWIARVVRWLRVLNELRVNVRRVYKWWNREWAQYQIALVIFNAARFWFGTIGRADTWRFCLDNFIYLGLSGEKNLKGYKRLFN